MPSPPPHCIHPRLVLAELFSSQGLCQGRDGTGQGQGQEMLHSEQCMCAPTPRLKVPLVWRSDSWLLPFPCLGAQLDQGR